MTFLLKVDPCQLYLVAPLPMRCYGQHACLHAPHIHKVCVAVHPDMADRDFYVTGESYAGHYVPSVSNRIFLENSKPSTDKQINLKGFAIGNGLTDPGIQYGGYSDFALKNNLISSGTGKVIKAVRSKMPTSAPVQSSVLTQPGCLTWATYSHACKSPVTGLMLDFAALSPIRSVLWCSVSSVSYIFELQLPSVPRQAGCWKVAGNVPYCLFHGLPQP